MRPFQDLVVWQKAHPLTVQVFRTTRSYPRDERFGLTAQTRGAAASVPANIAEGCGKRTRAQLRASLDIAGGSLNELHYWLILGRDLGYLPEERYRLQLLELANVRRLLIGFSSWSGR
jgi:four helix bundle protein